MNSYFLNAVYTQGQEETMIRHTMTSRHIDKSASSSPSSTVFPQALTARWLLRLIDMNFTEPDSDFFECVSWACGGLSELIELIDKDLASNGKRKNSSIRKAVRELSEVSRKHFYEELEYFVSNNYKVIPQLKKNIISILQGAAAEINMKSAEADLIQKFFGLDDDSTRLCEYAYMASSFSQISHYIEDCCDLDASNNRNELAEMLCIDKNRCRELITKLTEMGILDEDYEIRLTEIVQKALLEGSETNLKNTFCMPLHGETLPLEQFEIAKEAREDIVRLLQSDNEESLQVLLYGKPGVGKSTFVRSLAHELNLRAWSVPCRANDTVQNRRVALMACLRLARQYKGSFVLVDEAEHLLSTEDKNGNGDYSEKA